MEPFDLNAGRFYLRQLRHDDRVDDAPALTPIFAAQNPPQTLPVDFFESAAHDWRENNVLRWAVSEQTSIELVAMGVVWRNANGELEANVLTDGEMSRVLPNDDDSLEPVTVGDAVTAAEKSINGILRELSALI